MLNHHPPKTLHLNSSSNELVLLLRPDGSVLDARGPLTSSLIQQLQMRARVGQGKETFDLTIPQDQHHHWWGEGDSVYRVLLTPVLNQNARVAIMMVGLQLPYTVPFLAIWLFWGIVALLVAAIGG